MKKVQHSYSQAYAARTVQLERKTAETQVRLSLKLDGSGQHSIQSGVGFLDHMLAQVAVHGLFDLELVAHGDLTVDAHHTVEDIALVLGDAFDRCLGERTGIVRMASFYAPMDESLAFVALDLSGRPYPVIQTDWTAPTVGGLPVSLIDHFLESFASRARCNLHVRLLYGRDDHHKAEAIFKALGRALDAAVALDERRKEGVPSSKGTLSV